MFAFSGLTGLVLMSSVAFACTWIQGTMTASGSGAAGTAESIGSGGPDYGFPAMTFCSRTGTATVGRPGVAHVEISPYAGDPTSTNPMCVQGHQLPDSYTLKGPGSGTTLTPLGLDPIANPTCQIPTVGVGATVGVNSTTQTVGYTTGGCTGTPSIYTVTWTDSTDARDCMNNGNNPYNAPRVGSDPSNPLNNEIVIKDGRGSGDYVINAPAPADGGLCVSDIRGGRGNQVSLTII